MKKEKCFCDFAIIHMLYTGSKETSSKTANLIQSVMSKIKKNMKEQQEETNPNEEEVNPKVKARLLKYIGLKKSAATGEMEAWIWVWTSIFRIIELAYNHGELPPISEY